VSRIPAGDDVLDPNEPTYDLPGVAELLGVPVTRVHQVFFTDTGQVVKSLAGLLMVLHDGGYHDTEIVRWLFTPDPSLTVTRDGTRDAISNARPVDALHAHQAREVLRRAQAMAY
jgi:hypothetical protein